MATAIQERGWRHFSHEADLGICGWGQTVEAAFEEAALALMAAITSAEIVPVAQVEVACEAPDIEMLFVAWLNAIIYEMGVRRMLFGRFEVQIVGRKLRANIDGEPVDRTRHEPACEPKGATYTELEVSKDDRGRWTACCVVDV